VECDHLSLSPHPQERSPADWDVSFLNAKGFGGNNATATVVSPQVAMQWLGQRHDARVLAAWRLRNEGVAENAAAWDQALTEGSAEFIYRFDHEVRSEEHVRIEGDTMYIEGLAPISLLD